MRFQIIPRIILTMMLVFNILVTVYREGKKNDGLDWIAGIVGLLMLSIYVGLLYWGGFYS